MNPQKKIEINQSSLLSLKAELLRKRKEVENAKLSDSRILPTVFGKTKLKTKLDRINEGVNERDRKDAEEIQEESDILKKSQRALEAKSKLYDELSSKSKAVASQHLFLVDFENKKNVDDGDNDSDSESGAEDEDIVSEKDYDDDEEWIDFVDCLGRTKRCHRDDLESMKANDEKLRVSLFGSAPDREKTRENKVAEKNPAMVLPELCSEDMRRELLRKKWEEEEQKVLGLKNVHYQHVLFDEARTHGVGYYSFSTDEDERTRQMEALKNLRADTVRQQAVTQEANKRKKQQLADRLRAARRRKRERLGLPPEEESEDIVEEEEEKPEKPEELKREVQKPSTIRPWDIGKENTHRILTQEEWVQKKREERPDEFAPPKFLSDGYKKRRVDTAEVPEDNQEESSDSSSTDSDHDSEEPAPSVSHVQPPNATHLDMEKSIEEGLNLIRRQIEEREAQKTKSSLDVL